MRISAWKALAGVAVAVVLVAGPAGVASCRRNGPVSAARAAQEAEADLLRAPGLLEPETRQAVRLGAALAIRARLRSPEALFVQGAQLEREGDLAAAEDRYWDATEARPDYAAAWVALGLLLCRKGPREDLERGERALAWAVELEPEWPRARNAHATALRRLGRLEAAEAEARRSVELDPNDPAARNNLGNILMARGDLDGAAAEYEAAIALRPDLAFLHSNLQFNGV